MNNYFTSPAFWRYLSAKGLAATGTVRANRIENSPLQDMVKMNKGKRGSSDVATDMPSNTTAVHWKDNKVHNFYITW